MRIFLILMVLASSAMAAENPLLSTAARRVTFLHDMEVEKAADQYRKAVLEARKSYIEGLKEALGVELRRGAAGLDNAQKIRNKIVELEKSVNQPPSIPMIDQITTPIPVPPKVEPKPKPVQSPSVEKLKPKKSQATANGFLCTKPWTGFIFEGVPKRISFEYRTKSGQADTDFHLWVGNDGNLFDYMRDKAGSQGTITIDFEKGLKRRNDGVVEKFDPLKLSPLVLHVVKTDGGIEFFNVVVEEWVDAPKAPELKPGDPNFFGVPTN